MRDLRVLESREEGRKKCGSELGFHSITLPTSNLSCVFLLSFCYYILHLFFSWARRCKAQQYFFYCFLYILTSKP